MSGLKPRKYKQGSIIYFEGDKNKEIYILKSGKVILTTTSIESGEEKSEELKAGEFFGVKSSLGHYPREETAQTLADSVVLVMNSEEFEVIMSKNIRLVMKMLRVFSNQLRNLGKNVRQILGDTDLKKPSTELLKLAEYYFQSGKSDYAKFAYSKFLEVFPNDKFGDRAKEMLQLVNTDQPYPGKYMQLDEDEMAGDVFMPAQESPVAGESEMAMNNTPDAGISQPETTAPDAGLGQSEEEKKKPQDTALGQQQFEGEFALESSNIDF